MAHEKPSSRRDFLRGHSAFRALRAATSGIADQAENAIGAGLPIAGRVPLRRPPSGETAHLHTSRKAMACEFGVRYHAADGAYVDAPLAALDLVADLEDQLSIYRDYTEVSQINRTAAEHAVEVEPRLFTLLELCAWLHATTGGAFDITSGSLSRAWGFLKREGRLPSEEDIDSALQHVGFANVELDPDHHTVRFLKPGVEINFNAIGKGYALDRVAELLDERGLSDYLCEGGGSSVLARGRDRGGDTGGWAIGVPHPHMRDQHLGEVILRAEALGTSGAGTQFFEAGGRRFGHLIDPRTGWPAEGVYTATAVASTAAEADALSTAFYINGPGHTAEYCAEHKNVAAVLVCPREGGTEDAFDVHVFNLDGRRWIPAGG